jgi:hypothetical protein
MLMSSSPPGAAVVGHEFNFSTATSNHGPAVSVRNTALGSVASWGAVSASPGPSCNEIAFLDTPSVSGAIVAHSQVYSERLLFRVRPYACEPSLCLMCDHHAATPSTGYTLHLDSVGHWVDLGWCSRSIDGTGATWIGPAPKWVGYQRNGSAWMYRSEALYVTAAPYASAPAQGASYGDVFGSGQNITALRWSPSASAVRPHSCC